MVINATQSVTPSLGRLYNITRGMYDNSESMKLKVIYAKSQLLGGVSFQFLDYDDYRGKCDHGLSPLLTSIVNEVGTLRSDANAIKSSVISLLILIVVVLF